MVSKSLRHVVQGAKSEDHKRFEAVCESLGLPRSRSKRLVGALTGTIQGGELRSRDGVFQVARDRMHVGIQMRLALLYRALASWAGRATFAAAFWRPLFAVLGLVFIALPNLRSGRVVNDAVFDEVLCFTAMMPLAYSNIKAPLSGQVGCTDASPTGGGACVLQGPTRCTGEIAGEDSIPACPRKCGAQFCCLGCALSHEAACPHIKWRIPTFWEAYSGPNMPLTQAMMREGFAGQEPFDVMRDRRRDISTDNGKLKWDECTAEGANDFEHHSPDYQSFSRARGRLQGLGALRGPAHVCGFSGLKPQEARMVRQGNSMAVKMPWKGSSRQNV